MFLLALGYGIIEKILCLSLKDKAFVLFSGKSFEIEILVLVLMQPQ